MSEKLVIFFDSTEGYGWTEKYYWGGFQTGDALTAYFKSVAYLRAAFLTQDAKVVRFRLDTQYKRDPAIFDYENDPNCKGQLAETQNNSDNAVIVRMETPGTGYNRVLMRGIPDSTIVSNVFTPTPGWLSGFNNWVAQIRDSGNWFVQATVDNPQTPIRMLTVQRGFPKGFSFTLLPPGTLNVDDTVYITGSTVFGYNGIKNIVHKDTTVSPVVYYAGGAQPQQDANIVDKLYATPKFILDNAIVDMFYERFTTRAAGRPFGQRPGRRRTTLSLRP